MKLHAHFLADSANFSSDQTFTVFKGGITEIQALSFPAVAKFVIITRLEFDKDEAAKPHRMQTDAILPTRQHVAGNPQLIALRPDPNSPRTFANVISQMNAVFEEAGELVLQTSVDGQGLPLLYLAGRKVEVIG